MPIDFPDVVSLSSVEYAGRDCRLVNELFPLRNHFFFCLISKELLLRRQTPEVSSLTQYRNGDAANIKRRFDLRESSILLVEAWEESIFPSKRMWFNHRAFLDNPSIL